MCIQKKVYICGMGKRQIAAFLIGGIVGMLFVAQMKCKQDTVFIEKTDTVKLKYDTTPLNESESNIGALWIRTPVGYTIQHGITFAEATRIACREPIVNAKWLDNSMRGNLTLPLLWDIKTNGKKIRCGLKRP